MIQCLAIPCVLQHKRLSTVQKKQHTKKNMDAIEYVKILTERIKKAKLKNQEQIVKRDALFIISTEDI